MIPRTAVRLLGLVGIMLASSQSTQADSLPQYQRISVTRTTDIDRLYPIIAAYVQDPKLAGTVTEITIDRNGWRSPCFFNCDLNKPVTETEPTSPVRDSAYIALEEHVRNLKLGQDVTTAMIRSLEWKKRSIIGAWDGPKNEMEKRNQEFGSAALTILLSLCANIDTLYLDELPSIPPLKEYILKSNYGKTPVPGLQKLTKVEVFQIDRMGDERMYSTVEFLEVFQFFHHLPSIQSIVMNGVQEYQANRNLAVPQTGNMKKIHIGHADIPSSTLAKIIAIPRALNELEISLGGLWSTDGGSPMVQASQLSPALRQHQETLTLLDLDLDFAISSHDWTMYDESDEDDEDEMEEYETLEYGEEYLKIDRAIQAASSSKKEEDMGQENDQTIGSLNGFRSLTKLSISIKTLLGFDIKKTPGRLIDRLPPNLEYLRLYGYRRGSNTDLDEQIDELLALKTERLPKLNVVEGVDVVIPSLGDLFPQDIPEEGLWERPESEIGWKEVEVPKVEMGRDKDEL